MSARTVAAKKHVAGRQPESATLDLFEAIRDRVLETEKIERAAFTELSRIV